VLFLMANSQYYRVSLSPGQDVRTMKRAASKKAPPPTSLGRRGGGAGGGDLRPPGMRPPGIGCRCCICWLRCTCCICCMVSEVLGLFVSSRRRGR